MKKQRKGLRIRGQRGNTIVRDALKRFARWLRKEYKFPIRVPVYLNQHHQFKNLEGEEGVASFFAPDDPSIEPYIRIATGDYEELVVECGGKNDALASYICSLAHEIIHYQQWIINGATTEKGVEKKAVAILRRYSESVDEP